MQTTLEQSTHTLYRPPAEAYSLILRVADGCPWNRCAFCGMYKGVRYHAYPLREIEKQIIQAQHEWPDASRIFLADGDAMALSFRQLHRVLIMLNDHFPNLSRVSTYANGHSIMQKSIRELKELRSLKLNTLYMGLESGHDPTLKAVGKCSDSTEMVEAVRRAQACGFRMSVMFLIGLGGQRNSMAHAEATAKAINRMNPRFLSALRVIPVPGTRLFESEQNGSFEQLTEFQAVEELQEVVRGLELKNVIFRANHSSNIIPMEGRFPRDKARLLREMDALLASGKLHSASPGPMPVSL